MLIFCMLRARGRGLVSPRVLQHTTTTVPTLSLDLHYHLSSLKTKQMSVLSSYERSGLYRRASCSSPSLCDNLRPDTSSQCSKHPRELQSSPPAPPCPPPASSTLHRHQVSPSRDPGQEAGDLSLGPVQQDPAC